MVADYIFTSTSRCATCVWLRHRRLIKQAQVEELSRYEGNLSATDFMKKYNVPTGHRGFNNHLAHHIKAVPKAPAVVAVTATPQAPVEQLLETLTPRVNPHETALDVFISQFDEAIRGKQIKMTAKDGLQAIKIKADIENRNKDRSKDIFKMMVGADGNKPSGTETEE